MRNQPGGAQGQGQGQQRQGFNWMGLVMNGLIMYGIFSYMRGGGKDTVDPNTGKALPPHRAMFTGGETLELRLYVSEEQTFDDFNNTDALIWHIPRFVFDYDATFSKDVVIKPSKNVMNNGTLWAHVYVTKVGYSPDPQAAKYRRTVTFNGHRKMNEFLKKPKLTGKVNLISGEKEDTPEMIAERAKLESLTKDLIISFWKPNMTLQLVHDFTTYPRGSLPSQLKEHMNFDKSEEYYYPTLFFNEFWLMREHLFPLNETTPELPLHLEYATISLWRWQMMVQMEQSFAMQESLGALEGEKDEVKRMLIETNPYLLGLTIFVSILHSVFDFLAFKNDINFWKNRKSVEGLSVRTIFLNVFFQLVIFLYLLDNDTSWIILISSGVGVLIEMWKITKAVNVSIERRPGQLPRIHFKDKDTYSAKTKEHDDKAMQYMSYVLYPLVVGYAIYSLLYENHKSWYSWVLGSLTGFIYTFGFVMMTPQLFINYKLKSVAHMPWKTFMYKALNTFVDDLFAFIIKMPTMHRVACFRDDIIFFIFLYQRWIYPVDKSRMNEFGQVGDEVDAQEAIEGTATSTTTTTTTTTPPAAITDGKQKEE